MANIYSIDFKYVSFNNNSTIFDDTNINHKKSGVFLYLLELPFVVDNSNRMSPSNMMAQVPIWYEMWRDFILRISDDVIQNVYSRIYGKNLNIQAGIKKSDILQFIRQEHSNIFLGHLILLESQSGSSSQNIALDWDISVTQFSYKNYDSKSTFFKLLIPTNNNISQDDKNKSRNAIIQFLLLCNKYASNSNIAVRSIDRLNNSISEYFAFNDKNSKYLKLIEADPFAAFQTMLIDISGLISRDKALSDMNTKNEIHLCHLRKFRWIYETLHGVILLAYVIYIWNYTPSLSIAPKHGIKIEHLTTIFLFPPFIYGLIYFRLRIGQHLREISSLQNYIERLTLWSSSFEYRAEDQKYFMETFKHIIPSDMAKEEKDHLESLLDSAIKIIDKQK